MRRYERGVCSWGESRGRMMCAVASGAVITVSFHPSHYCTTSIWSSSSPPLTLAISRHSGTEGREDVADID